MSREERSGFKTSFENQFNKMNQDNTDREKNKSALTDQNQIKTSKSKSKKESSDNYSD